MEQPTTDSKSAQTYNQNLTDTTSQELHNAEIISALATLYTTIFLLKLEDKSYQVIKSVELMGDVAGISGTIDDVIKGILDAFMAEEMRPKMKKFLDLDTLPERLSNCDTIMTEYQDPRGHWFQSRFIAKSRDEEGNLAEALYVARDFTEEKKRELTLQEQLRNTAIQAERANASKTMFLRRMSHDIRTPLNGIVGMVNIAQRYKDDPEKVQDCREKITHSIDYLMDLVNNVLEISRLESGNFELENKPFNLGALLLRTIPIVEVNATENGIVFKGGRVSSKMEHLFVVGSPLHLNRVLMNIASNAIKYNRPGGSVELFCTELESDETTATYKFVCKDTGIGMSKDFQKHAFEPFAQEGKETTNGYSGSGLGLSIVKEIIEDGMGGTVELESEENVGTTVSITLTLELDQSQPQQIITTEEPDHPHVDLAGRKLLLVEDNDLNMEIAHVLLEDLGLSIIEAKNGKEALDIFAQSKPSEFSYIFMDVMMPVMNGLEATKEIRKLDRPDAQTVPIIAMTANAFIEDRNACLEAGMNTHMAKPIDPDLLRTTLEEFA